MAKRLTKSTDKKLFGVAGGVAEYFDQDPTLVRVGFVAAFVVVCPLAFVAYLVMAVMMPSPSPVAPGSSDAAASVDNGEEPRDRRNLLGWAVVGIGILIVIANLDIFSWPSWGLIAAVLIGVGVVLLTRRSSVT